MKRSIRTSNGLARARVASFSRVSLILIDGSASSRFTLLFRGPVMCEVTVSSPNNLNRAQRGPSIVTIVTLSLHYRSGSSFH